MKHIAIAALICLVFATNLFAQVDKKIENITVLPQNKISKFSIGWATLFTRYNTANRGYYRPVLLGLTPGNELQVIYHFNRNMSIISGINYQAIAMLSTKYTRYINPELPRRSAHVSQISIPLLLSVKITDNNKKFYQQIVAGVYLGETIVNFYITEHYYPTKGGWFEIGYDEHGVLNFSDNTSNFYNLYAGYKLNHIINNKFHINIEPYMAYQLKNEKVIEKVYNRFMFGFKAGLIFNFKTK